MRAACRRLPFGVEYYTVSLSEAYARFREWIAGVLLLQISVVWFLAQNCIINVRQQKVIHAATLVNPNEVPQLRCSRAWQ